MAHMKKAFLLLAIATMLLASVPSWAGKARSNPEGALFEPYLGVPADKALIYVYRQAEEWGWNRTFDFMHGETQVTKLKSSGYFPMVIDPGVARFGATRNDVFGVAIWEAGSNKSASTEIEVAAGEVHYLRFVQESHAFHFKLQLDPVTQEVGEIEIQECYRLLHHGATKKERKAGKKEGDQAHKEAKRRKKQEKKEANRRKKQEN